MNKSKISDHKRVKKELITPWNYLMGDKLELRSWYKERCPEYLWLVGIVDKYGRKEGLKLCYRIIEYIVNNSLKLDSLALSNIIKLNNPNLYDFINQLIGKEILDSFCIVSNDNKLFREKFYLLKNTNQNRINKIKEYMRLAQDGHSEIATDVRFLIVWFLAHKGTLKILKGMETADALTEYYHLEHTDEKMRLYGSLIRSTEVNSSMIYQDKEYIEYFWNIVGSISKCELSYINYQEVNTMDIKEYLNILKKEITLLVNEHSNEYTNSKFSVITSTFVYCLKLIDEIVENDLYFGISSRLIIRTIMDCYVNIKYLLLMEQENEKIWDEFIEYGLGKYKLINLKSRSNNYKEYTHVTFPVIEAFVNDEKDEEFLNVDLGNFKKSDMRVKFEKVGEKELYDYIYDYDIQFSHGHWGAIRESATTICSNPLHENHFLADTDFVTKCSSVKGDLIKIMNKFARLINEIYNEFNIKELEKYGLQN